MKKNLIYLVLIAFIILLFNNNIYALEYVKDETVDISLDNDFNSNQSIRMRSLCVDDSGKFNNSCDEIDLYKYMNNIYFNENSEYHSINDLIKAGYKTLAIEISFLAFEKDDGYQYVFLYDTKDQNTYLTGTRFEHTSGRCDMNTYMHVFYFEIDLYNITNHTLFIRYAASGNDSDDWYNSNVKYHCGFSKQERKIDGCYYHTRTADGVNKLTETTKLESYR